MTLRLPWGSVGFAHVMHEKVVGKAYPTQITTRVRT
jgi:hypothetical protein